MVVHDDWCATVGMMIVVVVVAAKFGVDECAENEGEECFQDDCFGRHCRYFNYVW